MKKIVIAIAAVLAVGAGVLVYRDQTAQRAERPTPPAPTPAAAPEAPEETPAAADGAPAPRSLFLRDVASGQNQLWRFGDDATPRMIAVQAADPGWTAELFAPRGWGGDDAVLWRNDASGELRWWRLGAEGEVLAVEILPYSGDEWRAAAALDADGDGDADLVWRNAAGGVAVWAMEAGKQVGQASIGEVANGWSLMATGDFNGDGRDELLWRMPTTGEVALWDLQGTQPANVRPIAGAGAEWRVLGAFDLDDRAGRDLLWQGADGVLIGWSGADAASAIAIERPATAGWTLFASTDVDGDGRGETIWREDAGLQLGAWRFGDGGKVVDLALPPLGPEWTLAPSGFVSR